MPIWCRQSSSDGKSSAADVQALREQARAAARQRRDIYLQIRALLPHIFSSTTYPSSSITIRTTYSPPFYTSLILYTPTQSTTLSPQNPVIAAGEDYYDDRILDVAAGEGTVLLSGMPGNGHTAAMCGLLERVQVCVRSGWRAGG